MSDNTEDNGRFEEMHYVRYEQDGEWHTSLFETEEAAAMFSVSARERGWEVDYHDPITVKV